MTEAWAGNAILFYPDYNKPFEIHSNASKYLMGGIVSQEGMTIAYLSKKLMTQTQQLYRNYWQLLLQQFERITQNSEISICTSIRS